MYLETDSVLHDFRVVKNVTITLPDDVALQARIWAEEGDVSLSRFLAQILSDRMQRASIYQRAQEDFFSREPVVLREDPRPYPTRSDVHEWLPHVADRRSRARADD
jgi:hypothetical protein